jgi:pimeloyl-ACP methyl ester carboxylesterase
VEDAVCEVWPYATPFRPELPASLFSMTDPNRIVADLLTEINKKVDNAEKEGQPFEHIILVGHSLGALLARKLYVVACGEISKAPFEGIYRRDSSALLEAKPWADKITRVVLFAGMNRGWRVSHHISLNRAPLWAIGSGICHVIRILARRSPLIFTIRRGAEFITQLRIQWLHMRLRARKPQTTEDANSPCSPGNALTIQLLGSIDDMVAPEDNVDLISGGDFVYLDVPYSGHADVINLDDKNHGASRKEKFLLALKGTREELDRAAVVPSDERFTEPDLNVKKMVFVVHGIRDAGYWTHKIARRVKQRSNGPLSEWATETSSYGYFPMLPFLFPWYRRQKVEWLMDQYTEALAHYPEASISYVGHSNGTYLLAKALELYPCCHFENVVFAGSVVSQHYNWQGLLMPKKPRVNAVLNFVATRDWVVAFFPKLFQFLGLQDLGSLGHDGFGLKVLEKNMYQAKYVRGGHGAAIEEPLWNMIADFVITGEANTEKFPCKGTPSTRGERFVQYLGRFPPIAWLMAGLIVYVIWLLVKYLVGIAIADPVSQAYVTGFAAAVYLLILWLLLTRI